MKLPSAPRQPRSIRYMIFVNGQHEQSDGRRVDAVKRARIIAQTWKTAREVVVLDTWAWKSEDRYAAIYLPAPQSYDFDMPF